MPSPVALRTLVQRAAGAQGFARAGVARASAVDDPARFLDWLAAGRHGTMRWLADRTAWRLDPREYFSPCESLVVVAEPYWSGRGRAGPCGRVSNYAWGASDYHDAMLPRLRALGATIDAAADSESKAVVDTAPVLEKYWATQAGIGWLGKHTNVLSRELGSWFFLGVVLTSARIAPDTPQTDHCGTCTACLDACPTAAFPAAYVLDARRCIAYLTIEHRGPVAEDLRPAMADHLFGCDDCQDVCPWNEQPFALADGPYASSAAWDSRTPMDVFTWSPAEFHGATRGTPVHRAKRQGLARNLAIVLGNRGAEQDIGALSVALGHDDATVREAAAWALGRIGGARARAALEAHAPRESEAHVRQAIAAGLGVA